MSGVWVSSHLVTVESSSQAVLSQSFLPSRTCELVHSHSHTCHKPCAYFYLHPGVLVCMDYGLKGGGCCSSKNQPVVKPKLTPVPQPTNSTTSNVESLGNEVENCGGERRDPRLNRVQVDTKDIQLNFPAKIKNKHARDALHHLEIALQTSDLAGISQSAEILQANSAEMDGQLIALIVPVLASGTLWNIGETAGKIARLDLVMLLRLAVFRHAARSEKLPGFVSTERHNYRNQLEICVKKIVKTDKIHQEVELQAELRACWAVIVSINDHRNIWDHLRGIIPRFAFMFGFIDPIRYAGPLVHGVIDLSLYAYDEYQDAKSRSLARQSGALSMLYIGRYNFSQSDAKLLWEMYSKCTRWNTAVLIVRLASTIISERIVPYSVRTELVNLLIEMSSFNHYYFRNNWKVRRTVLSHLVELKTGTMEVKLHIAIAEAVFIRSALEVESSVRVVLGQEENITTAREELRKPVYKERVEREIEAIGNQIRLLNEGITYRTEKRTEIVAEEIAEMTRTAENCRSLLTNESLKTQEICTNIELLRNRAMEMATDIYKIKTLLEQPEKRQKGLPVLRMLPQRNLEGKNFVGREEEVKTLMQIFSAPGARAVILGSAGVGKSTLALRFAYHAEAQGLFTNYLWVQAATSSTLTSDYLEIASDLQVTHGDDAAKVKYAKSALKTNPQTLLIYDNSDFEGLQTQSEIDYFLKTHLLFGAASVLVTSNNDTWRQHISTAIDLKPLHGQEAIEMIAGISGLPAQEFGPDIMTMFEGNPLSIKGFGSYLRQSKSLIELQRKLGKMTTGTAIDKLLELYYENCSDLGRKALESCSFLNPGHIDPRLTLRILRGLKAVQQTAAVTELSTLSLLESNSPGGLEMHRLVQEHVHSKMSDKTVVERVVAQSILEMLEEGLIKDPALLLNAMFFHDKRREMNETNRKIDMALVKYCLREKLAPEAKRISQAWMNSEDSTTSNGHAKPHHIRESSADLKVIPPIEEVKSRVLQGDVYFADGKFEEAEREYRLAAGMSEKHHCKQYVKSMHKLAILLQARDKGPAGREVMVKVLSRLDEANVSPQKRIEMYDLAGVLLGEEQSEEAITVFRKAIALGQKHNLAFSNLAKVQSHLADLYLKLQQQDEAIATYEASLETLKAVPTDPLRAHIHKHLSQCHQADWNQELTHLEKELDFRREHIRDDTAAEAANLLTSGSILAAHGSGGDAITKLEEAERLLEGDDPMLVEVYDELMLAWSRSNPDKAIEYQTLKEQAEKRLNS